MTEVFSPNRRQDHGLCTVPLVVIGFQIGIAMVTRGLKEKCIHFFQLHILGPQIYSKGLFISRIPKADQKAVLLRLSSRAVAGLAR